MGSFFFCLDNVPFSSERVNYENDMRRIGLGFIKNVSETQITPILHYLRILVLLCLASSWSLSHLDIGSAVAVLTTMALPCKGLFSPLKDVWRLANQSWNAGVTKPTELSFLNSAVQCVADIPKVTSWP